MADDLLIRLLIQDDATEKIRVLRNELRQLAADEDKILRRQGEWAGGKFIEGRTRSIREQIRAVDELSAAQIRASRFMESMASGAAARASDVLFPVERARQYASAFGEIEKQMGRAATGSASLNREMRHVVAAFDEISRGQRGQLFSTIGASFRDAGFSARTLVGGIGALAALMGGAAIIRGADKIGEMAERMRAAAAASGMSVSEFTAVAGALRLTGATADSADAALRHFAASIATAAAEPSSKAALAFHALGISQQEIAQNVNNVGGMLQTVAQRWGMYADGANKAQVGQELFGRGSERVAALLDRSGDATQRLMQRAQELGVVMTDQESIALADTAEKIHELSVAIEGGAIKAFYNWKPAIDAVIGSLTSLSAAAGTAIAAIGSVIRSGGVGYTTPESFITGTAGGGEAATSPFEGAAGRRGIQVGRRVPSTVGQADAMSQIRERVQAARNQAAIGGAGGTPASMRIAETQAEIAAYQRALSEFDLSEKERSQIKADISRANVTLSNQEAAGAGKAARQAYLDFAANERLKIQEAKGDQKQILAIYDEWLAAAQGKYRQNANVIAEIEKEKVKSIQQANQEAVREALEGAAAMDKAYADIERGFAARVTKQRGISPQQAIGFQMQEVGMISGEMQKPFQDVMANQDATQAQRVQAYWRLWDIGAGQQAKLDELTEKWRAAGDKASEQFSQPFRRAFDRIGSDLEASISELITGRMTLAQVWTRLASGVTSALVSGIGGGLSRAAAGPLGSALGVDVKGGQGIGDVIGNWFSQFIFGQGTQTGLLGAIAANTGATAAASTGSTVAGAAGAAGGIGGFFNFVKSILPFGAGGYDVPSYAGGAWSIPGGLSVLHPREMVLPANLAQGVRSMVSSGGGGNSMSLHFHGPADAPSMARWAKNFLRDSSSSLSRVMNSGAFKIG